MVKNLLDQDSEELEVQVQIDDDNGHMDALFKQLEVKSNEFENPPSENSFRGSMANQPPPLINTIMNYDSQIEQPSPSPIDAAFADNEEFKAF